MTPLDKCLETLRPLIEGADLSHVPVAELAIREMVDHEETDAAKANALSMLEATLASSNDVEEPPAVTRFTADLLDHIAKVQRSFRHTA